MEDLRLEAVPVVAHTQMESLVITWWLLLSHQELELNCYKLHACLVDYGMLAQSISCGHK
jgi:hypothetical protein